MIEVQIYIPLADNAGRPFNAELDAAFEMELRNLFGGYSLQPGLVTGEWMDREGRVYPDQNRAYIVSIKSIADGGLIRAAAEFAKSNYNQEAIYVRFLGLSEIL